MEVDTSRYKTETLTETTELRKTMEVTIGTVHPETGIMEVTMDIIETRPIVETLIKYVETMKPRIIERKDPKPQTETRHIGEDTTEKVGFLTKIVPYLGNGMTTIGPKPPTDMIERGGHYPHTTKFDNLNLEITMIETESYHLPITMIEKGDFEMTDKVQEKTSPQKETEIGIGARNTTARWYMTILNRGGIVPRIIVLTYTNYAESVQLMVYSRTMSLTV